MARSENQKLKLFYLRELLLKKTDIEILSTVLMSPVTYKLVVCSMMLIIHLQRLDQQMVM